MLQIAIIAIAFGIGISSFWVIKRKTKKLPDIPDAVFLEKYNLILPTASPNAILQERDYLAKILCVAPRKLDPTYTFDKLSEYLNYLGSYNLAIGDIEEEVSELFESLGVTRPYKSPNSVGELIFQIIQARNQSGKLKNETFHGSDSKD